MDDVQKGAYGPMKSPPGDNNSRTWVTHFKLKEDGRVWSGMTKIDLTTDEPKAAKVQSRHSISAKANPDGKTWTLDATYNTSHGLLSLTSEDVTSTLCKAEGGHFKCK